MKYDFLTKYLIKMNHYVLKMYKLPLAHLLLNKKIIYKNLKKYI
jgi:hypothetical protein